MSYIKPNYTQIPNILLDEQMQDMTGAELLVTLAIARKTIGWHKKSDKISIGQLREVTGLSKPGVRAGLLAGIDRGTIVRRKAGQTFSYSLSIEDADEPVDSTGKIFLPVDEQGGKKILPVDEQRGKKILPVEAKRGKKILPTKETLKEKQLLKKGDDGFFASDNEDSVHWEDIVKAYENEIGLFTAMSSEMVHEDYEQYSGQWLLDAISIAVEANHRKWSYCRGILRRWKVDGKQDKRASTNGDAQTGQMQIVDGVATFVQG